MKRKDRPMGGDRVGGGPPPAEVLRVSASTIDGLVHLLEHSLPQHGQKTQRSDIRRAVAEAVRAWDGPVEARWWKWLVEAGASLNLRVSVIENSLQEVLRWVEEGVQIATYLPDAEEPWVAVTGVSGKKYEVVRGSAENRSRRLSRRELQRELGARSRDGVVRVVAIEAALTCVADPHEGEALGGRPLSPLARTLLIIRAEWSDIWVVLVFSLLAGILALATPMAVQVMVSFVAFGRFLQPVIILSLMLLGLTSFWAALRLWETYIAEVLQRRLFARVVHDLSYRLPRVRQEAFDGHYGPELANRFFDVVTLQKVSTQFLLDAVDLVTVGLIGMVVLAVYHPFLLGFDVALLVSVAVIVFVLGRGGVRTSIQESKYKYSTAAWLEEITRCPLTFKLDNAAEFAAEKTEHLVSSYLEHRRLHFRVLLRQIAFALGLHALAGSVLLGVGGWLVIQGQLTLGQLVASEMIVAIIVGAFTKVGKHLEAFYDLMAGVDKLGTLFDLPLERQQGLMLLPETHPANVSVRNLTYGNDGHSILHDVTFDVVSGERVLLGGPVGSGKSILAELLYGIRNPTSGRILIDDHELSEVRPDVWRRHVMLLRPGEIFRGTVTENVHLENPDIDVRLVREACEQLGLLEGNGLPEGIATPLTSTGAPLSDSQLRLLAVARAIVHRPRLLIIDGLLDSLFGDAFDRAAQVLFAPDAPWTLIVVSSHPRVVERCGRRIDLAGPPGSSSEPDHDARSQPYLRR